MAEINAFVTLQELLPRRLLTRFVGSLARSRQAWVRWPFIHGFCRAYGIDLKDAEAQSLDEFDCFNAFFTRALRRDARPLAQPSTVLVSPVDGAVSQIGQVEAGTLFQAKGNRYPLTELLATPKEQQAAIAERYEGGRFATLYLAPSDYHRIHMPSTGTLLRSTAIPGELYSVNARTEAGIPNLFCRNERLALEFETDEGSLLMVLVGALIVGQIETVFDGPQSPYARIAHRAHRQTFTRGSEIGRFLLGSTVVLITSPGTPAWGSGLSPGCPVRMGAALSVI